VNKLNANKLINNAVNTRGNRWDPLLIINTRWDCRGDRREQVIVRATAVAANGDATVVLGRGNGCGDDRRNW